MAHKPQTKYNTIWEVDAALKNLNTLFPIEQLLFDDLTIEDTLASYEAMRAIHS